MYKLSELKRRYQEKLVTAGGGAKRTIGIVCITGFGGS